MELLGYILSQNHVSKNCRPEPPPLNCPMFEKTKIKNGFNLECMSSLVDLLNNSQNSTEQLIATSKPIHEILFINESYTSYYKTQDFHDKTGRCIVL